MAQQEELALKGITDPHDSDVLCGRGGAALRHPGNQTYRRLVNLNKGLYITCLKTEKLKISRSIVAAIREQRGRFLEKEQKSGTWFDIGDKKAIEKTSQALREGQPKLRQKIVEMGGAAALESEFGHHAGLYADQINLSAIGMPRHDPSMMMPPPHGVPHHHAGLQAAQHHEIAMAAAQSASLRQPEIRAMQPPHPDSAKQNLHAEMFERLSLRNLQESAAEEEAMLQARARQLRPSLTQRMNAPHELGMTADSQISLLSDFSAIGGSSQNVRADSMMSADSSFRNTLSNLPGTPGSQYSLSHAYQMDSFSNGAAAANGIGNLHPGALYTGAYGQQQLQQQQFQQQLHAANASSAAGSLTHSGRDKLAEKLAEIDRRHVFAKMKYRPGPIPKSSNHMKDSQTSLNDGMPDIYMVESQLSLYSNLSAMTDNKTIDSKPTVETGKVIDHSAVTHGPTNADGKPIVETGKVVDHSWGGPGLGAGSRHSLMSGLSRIDDSSIDHSIFSDLSKKIGDVSTRSMAMSEISVIDMAERDNEDESSTHTFNNDTADAPDAPDPAPSSADAAAPKKPATALDFEEL